MRDESDGMRDDEIISNGGWDPNGGETDPWTDADWQAIADYVTGEIDPAVGLAIEHRLATDPAFAQFAAPLMKMWRTPLPVRPRDRTAAWAAIEQKVAAAGSQMASQPSGSPAVSPPALPVVTAMPRREVSRWRVLTTPQFWVAAALTLIVLSNLVVYVNQRKQQQAFQYYAATERPHTVVLGDHSQVTLAPGAVLVAEEIRAGSATPRIVHLDGMGTFVVHADPQHPFVVESYGVSASAIGTTFTVSMHPGGGSKNPASPPSAASPASPQSSSPATDIQVSVMNGKVVVQRQTSPGHRETIAVLGPGEETYVQTLVRHFQGGWNEGAAHKSVAESYLDYHAVLAAESVQAAMRKSQGH